MSAGEMPAKFYYLAAQLYICISLEINIKYFAFNYPAPWQQQAQSQSQFWVLAVINKRWWSSATEIKTKLNFTVNKSLSPQIKVATAWVEVQLQRHATCIIY